MLLTKKSFLVGFLLWLAGASGAAQAPSQLARRISQATQVILISHHDFNSLVDKAGHAVPAPPFLVKGRPNQKLFLKSKVLTPAQRTRLSTILERPFQDRQIVTMHCCWPHHTIFLVGQNRTSYIDICFGCRCASASPDLALDGFDNRKWKELAAFFDKLGLSYGSI